MITPSEAESACRNIEVGHDVAGSLATIRAYVAQEAWIPVTDHLPTDGQVIIVSVMFGNVPASRFATYLVEKNGSIYLLNRGHTAIRADATDDRVTHWMPFPEPVALRAAQPTETEGAK